MPATRVSICSNALLLLGDQTIASLEEPSDRAVLAANLYESTRDDTLRAHPWNCAVKRVVLAPEIGAPPFDFSHSFVLPGDWLRTLQVGKEGDNIDYRNESGRILANGTALPLRYIWRNENESTWDAMLVKAMELAMAAAMAYGITQSTSQQELRERKLADHLKRCRSVDGQEDPPETLGDFPLLTARYGSSRRW